MDQLFQLLFKYKWTVFSKCVLGFASRPSWFLIILLAAGLALLVYIIYIRPGYRLTSARQIALTALRASLLALIGLLLLRPVLVVSSVVPQSTSLAVLVDESRSMQLSDEGGQTRLAAVKSALTRDSRLVKELEAKFRVKLYGFSDTTRNIPDVAQVTGEGPATDIAGALNGVIKDSGGLPLSAVVLVTDGAANTPRDLTDQIRELKARNLPVFTVGIGSTERFKDAEMVRVTTPRRVLVGSAVSAEALLRVNGYGAGKATIAVSEDGRAIKTETVQISNNEAHTVNVEFTPASIGSHRYTIEVKPYEGELTIENNAQESLIEVVDGHPKVLYIEGEPRWEYGKMRTSLMRNEKNLVLVSVLRSADGKFYRQGVESGQELEAGFPRTQEEFFAYDGLVLGSIEANFFSYEQLKMIEQFAARRGGGILALGGSRAFDAGKYASTPIAGLLPLDLDDRIDEAELPATANFKAELTSRGRTHAVTRLNEDRNLSAKAWEEMPAITVPEVLTTIKPGATVILDARSLVDRTRTVPLLVEERYGRGRSMALTASDTWRWRMLLDSKKTSHETFWRQLLRYLVSTTPKAIEVQTERDVYAAGDTVALRAEVNDKKYEPIKDATVVARVTPPDGKTVEIPMTFSLTENSVDYRADYSPGATGLYRVEIEARGKGAVLGRAQSTFLRSERSREFHEAMQNVDLLKRISAETGGKYYKLSQANDLSEDLSYLEGNNSEKVNKDLWDMPINLLLLVGLATGEWFLRKRSGLA